MDTTPPNAILALAADLLFASRIRAVAESAGRSVTLVRSADAAIEAVTAGAIRLAFLDLEARAIDVPALIRRIRAVPNAPHIVAFGRHTSTESLAAARAAGADRVLARSAFVRELPELLSAAG